MVVSLLATIHPPNRECLSPSSTLQGRVTVRLKTTGRCNASGQNPSDQCTRPHSFSPPNWPGRPGGRPHDRSADQAGSDRPGQRGGGGGCPEERSQASEAGVRDGEVPQPEGHRPRCGVGRGLYLLVFVVVVPVERLGGRGRCQPALECRPLRFWAVSAAACAA